MESNQVVLQSFIPQKLTVNFRYGEDQKDADGKLVENGYRKGDVIKNGGINKTVTIPSLFEAPKNIKILTAEDFQAIHEDIAEFLKLGQKGKGLVKLDDIPSGFWDPSQQIAAEKGKTAQAQGERDDAQFRVLELEEENKKLKETLVAYGWKE